MVHAIIKVKCSQIFDFIFFVKKAAGQVITMSLLCIMYGL